MTTYFVTGATGFIGRNLVERLLERGDVDVHVLVREGSQERLDALIERWDAQGRVHPVVGDLAQPKLGVKKGWITKHKGKIDHVFHLAAIYDMTAEEERNEVLNVGGTRNLVALVNELQPKVLHHTSSVAAAGSFKGLFREDMFDEGQKLPSAYHRTKFESERIVREESKVPWRVYRPAVVIGDSRTGEMDKVDGPYYFFKAIQRARDLLPQWFPLAGPEVGDTNLVPVDYVADAMDAIAHKDGLDGQAFHLAASRSVQSGAALNEFAKAAHAPQLALRVDSKLLDALPKGTLSLLMQLPALKGVRKAILDDFGIPDEIVGHMGFTCGFDTRDTERALEGTGIEVPELSSVRRAHLGLLGAQPRSGSVQGPLARGGDQRPHRRHHRRLQRHRTRRGREDRRGRRHPAARRPRLGEARGGQGRDRGRRRQRVRLHRGPRGHGLDRRARASRSCPSTLPST